MRGAADGQIPHIAWLKIGSLNGQPPVYASNSLLD